MIRASLAAALVLVATACADGIPADNGIQFDGLPSLGEARKLARGLRRD